MRDQIITGIIFLSHIPAASEAEAFLEYLTQSAVENGIWINTCERLKNSDSKDKYPPDDYWQKKYIPFEITDSPETDESDRISSGIWFRSDDYRIGDLSRSGLGDVQNFLVKIINHDLILNIHVLFDLVHGFWHTEDYIKCDIHAEDFCQTLMNLPTRCLLPTAEINIIKST